LILLGDSIPDIIDLKDFFLTQQYRLFSNYSASLQMDMCYSDYTRIKIIMFEIKQLCLLGLGMLWTPQTPPRLVLFVVFDFVGVVMEMDRSRKY
jgi:hypothetical protein